MSILKNIDKKRILVILGPVIAILFAFFVAGLVVLISGGNPILVYASLFSGAFSSVAGIRNTVTDTLPIILLAFSFSICNRCGYFNIGQDGQMVSASLAVIWIPTLLPRLSNNMQLTIMIISGILVGGAIALIPAIIKILLGVNEVITALLINYLVLLLSSYELVYTPIASNNSSAPTSIPIGPAIGPIFAIIAVVIIVIGYSLSLQNTVPGFQLRMVGKNSRFAQISGIKSTRTILFAALLGGSLAGLAATGQILGEYHIMYDGFATGLGNNGIIAALIGQNSPIGMVLSSFVLGSLQSGSVLLSVVTNVPSEIVQVITGFVMLFATINFVTILMKPLRRKSD